MSVRFLAPRSMETTPLSALDEGWRTRANV